MIDLDLEAIKARAEAAMPAPWTVEEGDRAGHNVYLDELSLSYPYIAEGFEQGYDDGKADAEFVAHAREDVPALVAEVERLRERLTVTDDMVDAAIMGWARQTWTDAEGSWDEQGWTGAEEYIKNIHRRRFRAALEAAFKEAAQ